ncbi:homeobox-leucine zipper protein HAT2 [Elaeis guineensis]|uniref:Homeobox-leucine zipper protein HOX11 n=1 Tax=Elaeis guineensis var. tenera TaxID=51953 RepID=A0A6I9R3T0_ELAGV|nr:homeobox-leucine zipper protein HOX11 [Elaeis guineensis]
MEVASSACNGDCSSSKQSRASRQEPNLMDKDGGALMIHPSLQLELKISWLAETDLEGNIDEAKSRRGLNVKEATRDADDTCDDMKPSSSTSHSMTAERGFEQCRNGGKGEGGKGGKKLRLSKEQSSYLEERFKEHTTLNPKQKLAIARRLNLRPRQVEVWFQNRRARTKLKQTEVDYEYLKQWREYLTEENRRLHKEIQELKSFESPIQNVYHFMQPTMLTICPSCQHAIGLQKNW